MPVLRAPRNHTHELPHARFYSLATPSRGSRETSVWRVQLTRGLETAAHTLTREEIFVVLSGSARVVLGGEASVAEAGDVIVVPANTEVSLACASDSAEVLCCLPVGGQARIGDGPSFTPPWAE